MSDCIQRELALAPRNSMVMHKLCILIYCMLYNTRDNYNTFSIEFNGMLQEYHSNSQNTYICCDFNIDLLKVNKVQFTAGYFNGILSAGYIPTITLPTRLSDSSSLIENIFTNNLSVEMSALILNSHISDRQPVVLFCDIHVLVHKHKYIISRSKSDEAKATFRSTFKNKHVLNKLDAESTDPNYNYEILENSLRESHNECFPTGTVRFSKRHKNTLWITSGIIKSINHINKLYKILKQRVLLC